MITAEFDMREFRAGLAAVRTVSSKSLSEQMRQRTLNVAGRAYDAISPIAVEVKRAVIKSYLRMPLATRIKKRSKAKDGMNFRQKGAASKQLQRVHLIIQSKRGLIVAKGLYGAEMTAAASKFVRKSLVSVGFLKSVFIPIMKGLNRVCKFKKNFARNISIWPGSAGHGEVSLTDNKRDISPQATLAMLWKYKDKHLTGGAQGIIIRALQGALNAEGREMTEHTRRTLQRDLDAHPKLQAR